VHIYVDADACPVVQPIVDVAHAYGLSVTLVKNYSHYSHSEYPAHVTTVYVDKGSDAADFKIVQLAKKGDIVITQDYGLASLCLNKQCYVMHHKGFLFTEHNIDRLLHSRHMSMMARRSGERTKGPKAFSKEDENAFIEAFEQLITEKL